MNRLHLSLIVTCMCLAACGRKNEPAPTTNTPVAPSSQGLMLTANQIMLANVSVEKISFSSASQKKRINGRLTVNETNTRSVASRVGGRIERLYIKEEGERVRVGDPLYDIYSEPLLTLIAEYRVAQNASEGTTDRETTQALLAGAEQKLLRYGLTRRQIESAKTQLPGYVTFFSAVDAVVTAVDVTEGQSVNEGTVLFRMDDLRTLWLEVELYPGESTPFSPGKKISVMILNISTSATVVSLNPELHANNQHIIMRAVLDNADGQLHAGMQASVLLPSDPSPGIWIPVDAVISDHQGSHVYIMSEKNLFEARAVSIGETRNGLIEITNGLREGDEVVITGAFLLNAEYILKRGGEPLAMHQN